VPHDKISAPPFFSAITCIAAIILHENTPNVDDISPVVQKPYSGQGRLIVEVSRSHTGRHTTLGQTPLDEGSARHRDLYPTTNKIHNRQISIPSAEFEPAIPASERPQTYAFDREGTGIGSHDIKNQM
jgi:hypothetical protein